MAEEEDFQIIVSKEDYAKYNQDKVKFKQFQKLFAELIQTNGQLQAQNNLLKKSFFSKKEEIKYLVDLINKFIDKCNQSQPLVQMIDIQQSVYENLVQNNSNGISSIQAFGLNQQFKKNYQKIQFELERISEIASYSAIPICPKQKSKSGDVQQLKPAEIQLQEQKNIVAKLLQQKLKLQKEVEFYKAKDKQSKYKIQEYEYKMNNNKTNKEQKSYFIKLLIDEYYRDLQVKLRNMKLQRNQIQAIVASQMNGIKQYIESTLKKLSINQKSRK